MHTSTAPVLYEYASSSGLEAIRQLPMPWKCGTNSIFPPFLTMHMSIMQGLLFSNEEMLGSSAQQAHSPPAH